MFRLIWAASVRTHSILSYAPTNLLIAATRTRRGLRWGIPVMLLAIPYLLAAYWCVTTIEAGGPGWLNLVVLLCAWNSIKLILNGPITVILLIRAILRDHRAHRVARSLERGSPTPA
ncbi:sulfate permease [Microbacterium sp. CBA3102]|uniref:sulfate permease n=1 Tax=Microbacterium sp. CBA3102 TaxID=2603598 RepID=UPI0011BB23B3|nr:sulfate permease [Microbacterium sp. CBA3102]QEA30061.1 sulfate permease [Microbacterium sp. CBA3102]